MRVLGVHPQISRPKTKREFNVLHRLSPLHGLYLRRGWTLRSHTPSSIHCPSQNGYICKRHQDQSHGSTNSIVDIKKLSLSKARAQDRGKVGGKKNSQIPRARCGRECVIKHFSKLLKRKIPFLDLSPVSLDRSAVSLRVYSHTN